LQKIKEEEIKKINDGIVNNIFLEYDNEQEKAEHESMLKDLNESEERSKKEKSNVKKEQYDDYDD
ncbi:MAG: hypothetical protein II670_10105, partial [Alphaproteobacteria bacterium]|nr:hypothetical protein [Alphaproteobacteria bacterium]